MVQMRAPSPSRGTVAGDRLRVVRLLERLRTEGATDTEGAPIWGTFGASQGEMFSESWRRMTATAGEREMVDYEYVQSRGAHGVHSYGQFDAFVGSQREIWIGSDGSGLIRETGGPASFSPRKAGRAGKRLAAGS
jgi:hypothetical protein